MSSSRRGTRPLLFLSCLAVAVFAGWNAPGAGIPAPNLEPELEPLRPFLGSWVGHFDDPDETMEIYATWSEILGGQAVREVRTVPDAGRFEAETLYYFDRETAVVSYLSVTNNGYVTRGRIALDGGHIVTEGKQVRPDSTVHSTHGTYTFRNDGTLVNEGGHTIIFERR
jgi:hypothetical protein